MINLAEAVPLNQSQAAPEQPTVTAQGPVQVNDITTHMLLHDGLLFLATVLVAATVEDQDITYAEVVNQTTKWAIEFAQIQQERINATVPEDAVNQDPED